MATEALGPLRLGRKTRLKQARDFRRLRETGERMSSGCLLANWVRLPPGAGSRLGVIASGKIGGAVVRNRAKRVLRESFRMHQHDLTGSVDLVLVARASIVGKSFANVEKDFLTLLRKGRLLKLAPGASQR